MSAVHGQAIERPGGEAACAPPGGLLSTRVGQVGVGLLVCLLLGAVAWWLGRSRATRSLAASAPSVVGPPTKRCGPSSPCLALLIDDVGRDLTALAALMRLPLTLTYSVLPHARDSAESVRWLRLGAFEYWLHLPLAPKDGDQITDEPVVLGRSSAPMQSAVDDCLRRVPGATGVNNHMGSAFSEQPMRLISLFGALRRRRPDLLMLDSRTSPQSQICAVWRRSMGEAASTRAASTCQQRDVFLDDPNDPATVDYRLRQAERLAVERGWAVAIGHPSQSTVRALGRFARRRSSGVSAVRFVRLSRVFSALGTPLTTAPK